MDATNINLIGGILLALVPLLGIAIVNIIIAWRQGTRLDAVAEKTAQIETNVNSKASAAEGREIALQKENALLREHLADQKNTAGLLAQAVAIRAAPVGSVGGTAATDSLRKIDDNTAAIEINTKQTKAKVDALVPTKRKGK